MIPYPVNAYEKYFLVSYLGNWGQNHKKETVKAYSNKNKISKVSFSST